MGNLSVKTLYGKRAALYDYVFIDFFRYGASLESFFLANDLIQSGDKVLDAGCGSGALTLAIDRANRKKGIVKVDFYGFDLTPQMLKLFQRKIDQNSLKNIETLEGNVLKPDLLPNEWKSFDWVVSSAMLEHLSKGKIELALSNLKGKIKADGKIIIFITKKSVLMNWLIKKWWKANMYEEDELVSIFQKVGFRDIQFRKFSRKHFYINSWGYIIIAKN